MDSDSLKILLIEDSPTDAELAERVLRRAELRFVLRRVETQAGFLSELEAFRPDVIVADYALPGFDGITALGIVRELAPETPFIVFSGSLGDERAVEVLKLGATDYVLKDRMQRLPAAILRARQEALDLLERKRIERELHREKELVSNVIETTASLVAVLDAEGRIVRSNPAFARVTGLASEELSGLPWEVALAAEPMPGIQAVLRDTLAGRPSQFELALLTRSGSRRTILWQSSAIHRPNGFPEYVVLAGIDLTETRRLEQQIEQSRRIDSLGRVAATIAHEFNNVLMMIQSSATSIGKDPTNPDAVQNAAERIAQAIKRGARITQDVTRFARPAEVVLEPIAVNAWMCALADDLRRVLSERVLLDLILPVEEPWVLGDPEQLYQVFSNLLVNARDALSEGGRITVTVEEPLEGDERFVHFSVHDTGSGVPQEALVRIFEPFFTTKRQGTGLGLAVASQTVVAHGGQISVESAASAGTTFNILLPRLPKEPQRH